MRTLTVTKWQKVRNVVSNLIDRKRQYSISGEISFDISGGIKPDLVAMKEIVTKVCTQFPWKDGDCTNTKETKSGTYLSNGKITPHESDESLMTVTFVVTPIIGLVRRGQVFAYGRYLDMIVLKIMQEAEARIFDGVSFAGSIKGFHNKIEAKSESSFKSE